ncbi:formylglycine-generating enzyme family protein [Candidatus Marithrix sp. Canyon 246]|uniref:formylglycine-generating enzyme family protein n=1 Tax=Candidatus Marithrix sp. Canyon 246 TaxID=1827136 RepID=UPI00084A0D81|nr:formylglycine-generating enzyme family protein [Candidatus Marithrix sp. Canyon 246]
MKLKYTIYLLSLATPLAAETNCLQDKNKSLYEIISCLNNEIQQLKSELAKVKENIFVPKFFRDKLKNGDFSPEMVMIPAGSFMMGDIQGDGGSDEQPVHEVYVKQFAMGKYEVTVGEFRKFVNAENYKTDAEKQGRCKIYDKSWKDVKGANWRNTKFSQNDNHPLVCVTWNDATAYTEWLSNQTGKQYSLPTEAEWEYAARAGTETKYWWGNEIGKNNGVCHSSYCGDSFEYTSDVGSFAANKFGLYDTSGNVWERACSELTDKYNGKEKVCFSKKNTNQKLVFRGGSLNGNRWDITTSRRSYGYLTLPIHSAGFRVVRAVPTN